MAKRKKKSRSPKKTPGRKARKPDPNKIDKRNCVAIEGFDPGNSLYFHLGDWGSPHLPQWFKTKRTGDCTTKAVAATTVAASIRRNLKTTVLLDGTAVYVHKDDLRNYSTFLS